MKDIQQLTFDARLICVVMSALLESLTTGTTLATCPHVGRRKLYRGAQNGAQNRVKKDPGRARQSRLATAGTNFTKPGEHY